MIRKTIVIVVLFLGIILPDLFGQNGLALYNMNLPQNHLMNPALRPTNSVYIGLPVISGFSITENNNFVNLSDVLMKDHSSGEIISFLHPDYNVDDFLAKIKDKNFIEPQVNVQLFGLGFSVGKGNYFFLDINERIEGNAVIPGDLFRLMLKGNEGFAGSKIDLSSLRGDLRYYREIGLGFSRNFSNKLRIGVKGKFLSGITAASINNKSLGITIDNNYAHTLDADLTFNISAPLDVYMDDKDNIDSIVFDKSRFDNARGIKNFLSGSGNTGFGLDIGATYDITDKIIVSAAVTDLGFIKWKKDVTNLQMESQFKFSGLSMLDVFNGTKTFEEVGNEMADSLKNSLIVSDLQNPFTTWLPFTVTIGGNYKLTKNVSFGLLSYSRIIGKQIREALSLSANLNVRNLFSAALSYTITNHRADNLGAGLSFRAGVCQFYLLTDRIPLKWNRMKFDKGSSLILPANWNTLNFRLGMNLVFGNRVSRKDDKPMVDL